MSFREDISVQLCMFYITFGFSMGRERIRVFIIYQTCYFNFSSGFYIYIYTGRFESGSPKSVIRSCSDYKLATYCRCNTSLHVKTRPATSNVH